jgi:hypothetical protein
MPTSLDSSTTQQRKSLPPELQAPDPETVFAANATAGKPALPPSLMPPDLPPELQPPDPPRQRQVQFQDQAQAASPEHPSYWSRIKNIPGDIVGVFEQGLDEFRRLEREREARNAPAPGTPTNPLTAARASQGHLGEFLSIVKAAGALAGTDRQRRLGDAIGCPGPCPSLA